MRAGGGSASLNAGDSGLTLIQLMAASSAYSFTANGQAGLALIDLNPFGIDLFIKLYSLGYLTIVVLLVALLFKRKKLHLPLKQSRLTRRIAKKKSRTFK